MKAIIEFDHTWDKESIEQAFECNNGIVGIEVVDGHCGKCSKNQSAEKILGEIMWWYNHRGFGGGKASELFEMAKKIGITEEMRL